MIGQSQCMAAGQHLLVYHTKGKAHLCCSVSCGLHLLQPLLQGFALCSGSLGRRHLLSERRLEGIYFGRQRLL